jgi:hypothetical protein
MRVETDAGEGFLKTLGNPEGPHALASEWVGTRLAELLDIPTLDFTLIAVDPGVELPMAHGGNAVAGPAFISKVDKGYSWGGGADELALVTNKADLAGLVVLDTWIRNRDRHCNGHRPRRNEDNVWLSSTQARRKVMVKAIDHTHCFGDTPHFTTALSNISVVQDDRVFGLFPEFQGYFDEAALQVACDRLAALTAAQIKPLIDSIPEKWEVSALVREAWLDLLVRRTAYVSSSLVGKVFPATMVC